MANKLVFYLKNYIKNIFTSKYNLQRQLQELEARVFNLEKSNLIVVKSFLSLVNSIEEDKQKFSNNSKISRNNRSNSVQRKASNLSSSSSGSDKEPTYH